MYRFFSIFTIVLPFCLLQKMRYNWSFYLFLLFAIMMITHQTTTQTAGYEITQNDRYGLAFINAADNLSNDERFTGALETGVQWDRWPLYWHWVDADGYVGSHTNGTHDYDRLVIDDLNNGLKPIAILLGTPNQRARTGSRTAPLPRVRDKTAWLTRQEITQTSYAASPPKDMFEPIFSRNRDGQIIVNQANSWAVFVNETVERYKPGGTLAQTQGWPDGKGIRHWEIWNEPDLKQFWSGSPEEYYRLLSVAYQTIKANDPQATVLVGGFAFFEQPDFLPQLLAQAGNDPQKAYFDVLSYHYYWSIYDGEHWLYQTRQSLNKADLSHVPIWITESGVPIWDDFPATSYNVPSDSPWRGTSLEQSAYIIQNSTIAFYYGVERYYHFMLHDDCGNHPSDAFGLRQNFTPHDCNPAQGALRPGYMAYQFATQQFRDLIPISRLKSDNYDLFRFKRPHDQAQISVIWATKGNDVSVAITAQADQADLYWIDSAIQTRHLAGARSGSWVHQNRLIADNGLYHLTLPKATNRNSIVPDDIYHIGGRPYILIEIGEASTSTPWPTPTSINTPTMTATPMLTGTPTMTSSATVTATPMLTGTPTPVRQRVYLPVIRKIMLTDLSNAVLDGDFETGRLDNYWDTPNNGVKLVEEGYQSHWAARFGDETALQLTCHQNGQIGHLATLKQQVTIPSQSRIELSFVYKIETTQQVFSYAWFEVVVIAEGEQPVYLTPTEGLWQATDWKTQRFDMSAWRGQTVELLFQSVNCTPQPFSSSLDQVRIQADETAATCWVTVRRLTACENRGKHHIFIRLRGSQGHALPDNTVRVSWSDGSVDIHTGLKAEDAGLVEFTMYPGNYWVDIPNTDCETVGPLTTEIPEGEYCDGELGNSLYHYSYEVIFHNIR